MLDKVKDFFKELDSSTVMILVFAAILVIFLIILIVVTVHVLKSTNDDEDEIKSSKKAEKAKKKYEPDDSYEEEEEDEEDENSPGKVAAAVNQYVAESLKASQAGYSASVNGSDTSEEEDEEEYEDEEYEDEEDEDDEAASKIDSFRAGFNASAAGRNTDSVKADDSMSSEVAASNAAMEAEINKAVGSELSQADAKTNEIDTKAIKEALRAEREQSDSKKAAIDAESADYNAKMDSAFVPEGTVVSDIPDGIPVNKVEGFVLSDEAIESATEASLAEHDKVVSQSEDKITVNPVNAVNINTVNSVDRVDTKSDEAGISGIQDMESFLTENPVPKKKKKKVKKRDQVFEDKFESDDNEIPTGEYFWYNSQDIDGLKRKEDMYYYCHYFSKPSQAVIPLVTEMYDCAFVRTEEIQLIAYGVQFKSMRMKDILMAEEGVGFDHSNATKEPSEKDFQEIYRKWCGYVDNFLTIIVINGPDNVKMYLKNALYEYGRNNDVETLLHSPE